MRIRHKKQVYGEIFKIAWDLRRIMGFMGYDRFNTNAVSRIITHRVAHYKPVTGYFQFSTESIKQVQTLCFLHRLKYMSIIHANKNKREKTIRYTV